MAEIAWDFWTEGADGPDYSQSIYEVVKKSFPGGAYGLEIGVRFGKSALPFLLANASNRLIGVDPNPEFPILDFMEERGVSSRFTFINDYSPGAIEGMDHEMFDYIYVDGRHDYEGVMLDFKAAWPLLKTGGLMLFDDYIKGLGYGTEVEDVLVDHTKHITGRDFVYKTMEDFGCSPNPHGTAILVK